MKKAQIIGALVLLSVLAAFGAVYQFYFAEKLEKYKQDKVFKEQLDTTLLDLEDVFDGRDPKMVIQEWKYQIQPWVETRNERAQFFDNSAWYEYDATREEGGLLRVWYGEKSQEMLADLFQQVRAAGLERLFPYDIRQEFDVPSASEWANVNVTERMVRKALRRLSFGVSLCEMLIEAKVKAIDAIEIWDVRQRPKDKGLLVMATVGVRCRMTMKDLVDFVEDDIMLADRHFEIDHLRISNPYIAYSRQEPWMEVEFLLTQAHYVGSTTLEAKPGAPGAPGAVGAGRQFVNNRTNNTAQPTEELGAFGKAWKWFKRNILYMN